MKKFVLSKCTDRSRSLILRFVTYLMIEHTVYRFLCLQVGKGTYSNVYKAREKNTGKIVALKKVRFDTSEPASVQFMAREIIILRKLDHPNIIKLEGIATSRMQYSLYLVLDFMPSDLMKVIARPEERLTEPQVNKKKRKLPRYTLLLNHEMIMLLNLEGQVLYATIAWGSAALS